MAVTITVQLSGPAEEVLERLRPLLGVAQNPSERLAYEEAEAEDGGADDFWDPDRLAALVSRITEQARRALERIARDAPYASVDDVRDAIDLSRTTFNATMASITRGIQALDGEDHPIWGWDKGRQSWTMDPELGERILEAIRRYEEA